MNIKNSNEVSVEPVEGLPGVTVRWLWAAKDGVPNFALRLFEVQPGASTFYHTHAHEHEVYVLSGKAILRGKDGEHLLEPDDTVFVPGHDEHQFVNTGEDVLRFLCAVPLTT
jgi:quercetin dioxygenase-like cupin family protein